jgi:hypothetical protein
MLEPPDDDSGRDANLLRKPDTGSLAKVGSKRELLPWLGCNE